MLAFLTPFFQDSDTEGEDFSEELDNVSDDEVDADDDAETGKKRKVCFGGVVPSDCLILLQRSAKKAAGSKKTKKPKKEATSDADDD